MPTTRTRGLAIIGTLAAACLVATPTVAATTTASPLTAPTALRTVSQADLPMVDLPPSGEIQVTDDAVYFTDNNPYPESLDHPLLMRRTLTSGPAGTSVGPVTAVGTMAQRDYAAHGASVAYTRASDQNVVIVDAAGAATVPTWTQPGQFTYGVVDLNDSWIAGFGRINDQSVDSVHNRQTGARVPLKELTPKPGGCTATVFDIAVSETRAVWSARCWAAATVYDGLYSVALDPADADGAVGSVTELATASRAASSSTSTHFEVLDTDTDLIAWIRTELNGNSVTSRTLGWQRSAPYTGAAGAIALDATTQLVDVDGAVVVLNRFFPGGADAAWYDLAGPATTPVRTIDLDWYGPAEAATARFVVWSGGRSWGFRRLADVTGGALSVETGPAPQFSDVRPSDPFSADITWLGAQGITGGYSDGTFRPLASVNRDAMAAFLYRMIHGGLDAPDCTTAAFTDVPASHPFCGEIAWLASTGITTGWPDGTFRPGQPVTREAMAAFLYRTGSPGRMACTDAPFTDVAASHPFCPEISWMAAQWISTGWPDGTFRPGLTIERQAMAAFLHRVATGS